MDFFAAADLDQLLATFGEPVTLDDGTAIGYACTGIFDAAYRLVDLSGMGAESYAPALTVKATAAAGAAVIHGSGVEVAGKTYTVAGIQPERPDGKGLTLLILTEDES